MPDRILGTLVGDIAAGTKPSLFATTVQADIGRIAGAAWHKGPTAPASAQEDDFWYDTASGQLRRLKSGLWVADLALANRVKLVSPDKGGHYQSLVAALAAITDAAAGNEYTVLVEGDIAETTLVTAKSYVHVVGLGHATVTVTHTGTVPAARFLDLTHCTWRDLDVIRAGTGNSNNYAIEIRGTCDRTVRLERVRGLNQATSSRSIGLLLLDTAAPTLLYSDFQGGGDGSTTTLNHGVFCQAGSPDPYAEGCRFYGGTSGEGGYLDGGCRGEWVGCLFEATVSGSGLRCPTGAAPHLRTCRMKAGDGAANSYGLRAEGGSFIRAQHCTARGSTFGVNGIGWYFLGSASAELEECATTLAGGETGTAYTAANNGRFQAVTAYPFQVASLAVNVTTATASGVLALGTTVGGSELASGISLATTGVKTVALPAAADAILAAGAYIYATVTGASAADGSFTIYVGYVAAGAQQHALYNTSTGRVNVRGGTYLANAASEAVIFDGDNNADLFTLQGATIAARRALPIGQQKAAVKSLTQTSAGKWLRAVVCVLQGDVLNTTVAPLRRAGGNVVTALGPPSRLPDDFTFTTPGWDYGLRASLSGSQAAPSLWLALTDSVGQGFMPSGTDSWPDFGYIGQLATALFNAYGMAGEYDTVANATTFPTPGSSYHGREYWTFVTGSGLASNLWGLGRAPTWTATGVMPLATLTIPYAVTRCDVFYVDNTAGTWDWRVNGAGGGTLTMTNDKTVKRLQVGALAQGAVVTFGNQSITQALALNGVSLWKDQTKGVFFGRATHTGMTATELVRSGYFPANKIVLWQGNTATAAPFNVGNLGPGPTNPHVAVIELGLNDANTGEGLYRYTSGLRRLCSALRRGSADCSIILVAAASPDGDSSDSTGLAGTYGSDGRWVHWIEAMKDVAVEFHGAVLNCHALFGETSVAAGRMSASSIHPLRAGHDAMAQALIRLAMPTV